MQSSKVVIHESLKFTQKFLSVLTAFVSIFFFFKSRSQNVEIAQMVFSITLFSIVLLLCCLSVILKFIHTLNFKL